MRISWCNSQSTKAATCLLQGEYRSQKRSFLDLKNENFKFCESREVSLEKIFLKPEDPFRNEKIRLVTQIAQFFETIKEIR